MRKLSKYLLVKSLKSLRIVRMKQKKKKELDDQLMQLPNLIDNKTPIGSSENDNKVIKYNGKKPMFDFKPKTISLPKI